MKTHLTRGAFRRAALACVLALAAAPAHAQVRRVRLTLDNDAYDFWVPQYRRADYDYSNGVELSVERAGAPAWARRIAPRARPCSGLEAADSACTATTLAFGQKIFTPEEWDDDPVPGQRPYAGWLYGSAAVQAQTAARRRVLGIDAGITGPASLGEAVQVTLHRIGGFYHPLGWSHQLRFEPAAALRYDESRVLADVHSGGTRVLTLVPTIGGDGGTLHAGAHAELAARAGWAVPHPWRMAAERGGVAVYGTARVRGDVVARDLFLNGSTWRSSVRVSPRAVTWEHELGVGGRFRRFSAEYRAITRSREYAAEVGPHAWSTFELAYALR